ncbi:MAG TPA: FHA domain-containing protein [Polyangiaceae bacterium]|nr:FHA domain-containing protein [Polyangiaceae bacterium]
MGISGQFKAPDGPSSAPDDEVAHYWLKVGKREIPVNSGETLIGRGMDCHVVVSEGLVSRRHARVVMEGGRPYVEDLGSANGTFVNQARLHGRALLFPGDHIFIGTQEIEVVRQMGEDRPTRPTLERYDDTESNTPESGVSVFEPAKSEHPTSSGPHVRSPSSSGQHGRSPPSSGQHSRPSLSRLETQKVRELSETEAFEYAARLADKMFALGRVDAAQTLLEEPLGEWLSAARVGRLPPPLLIDALGRYALRLAAETLSSRWVDVAIELHLHAARPLREESVQTLASLRAKAPVGDELLLLRYYERLRATLSALSPQDRVLYERIACLVPGIEDT